MTHTGRTIIRRKRLEARTGYSRSTVYVRIDEGLLPPPVSLGPRAVGWPEDEVDAINAARIAGKSDAEIRLLVERLMNRRRDAANQ